MKTKHTLTICALSIGLSVLGRAQDIKFTVPNTPTGQQPAAPAAAPAAPAAAPTFTNVQECEEFGWFLAKRIGIAELEFTPEQIDAISKGVTEALTGHPSPYDLQKIGPPMDAFTQGKQKVLLTKIKQRNIAMGEAAFEKLKQNKNVVELPSGLRYEILKPGDGPFPTINDTVTVQYTGSLLDGTVFDSTAQRGKPLVIPLGQGNAIPGWVEGVQKINKGGKIRLFIPPQLAYGDNGNRVVPPSSVLVFEVELVDFKPTEAAPSAK